MREAQSCTLREEIEMLQGTLEDSQSCVERLKDELNETKLKRESAEHHLTDLEKTVGTQRKQIDECDHIKRDLTALTSEYAKLQYASVMQNKSSYTGTVVRALMSHTPWTVLLIAYVAQFVVTPVQRYNGPSF